MRRRLPTLLAPLLLLGAPAPARAGDAPLPPAVREVVEAAAAGDRERLARLAGERERDPWALVDDLLAAGERPAAEAYLAALGDPDAEALRRFAVSPPAPEAEARSALRAAEAAFAAGDAAGALRALAGAPAARGDALACRTALLRARLRVALGESGEGPDAYPEARRHAERLGIAAAWAAEGFVRRGRELREEGDLRASLSLLERGAVQHRLAGPSARAALAEQDLAVVLLDLGVAGEARRTLERSHSLLRGAAGAAEGSPRVRLRRAVAAHEMLLCQACSLLGDFAAALAWGAAALRGMREAGAPEDVADAELEVGNACFDAGIYEEALRHYEAGLAALPAGEASPTARLPLEMSRGNALQHAGRLREAAALLREVLARTEGDEAAELRPYARLALAETLLRQGDAAESGTLARAVAEDEGAPEVLRAYGWWLAGLGLLEAGDGDAADRARRAEEALHRAVAALGESSDPWLRPLARAALAEAELRLGSGAEAWRLARAALDDLDRATTALASSEMVQARTHEDRWRIARAAIRAARETGRADLLFEALERTRGRALAASRGRREALLGLQADPAVRARIEARQRAVSLARAELASAGEGEARGRARAALREAEDALTTTLADLERAVGRAGSVSADAVPLERVRAALAEDEALVLYSLLPDGLAAVLVRRDGASVVRLGSPAEMEEALATAARVTSATETSVFQAAVRALAKALLAPLALPKPPRRLYVSPDGDLAHLPWPLVASAAWGEGTTAALTPSAATFLALHGARGRRLAAPRVLLGDPRYADAAPADSPQRRLEDLAGTAAEIEAVARPGDRVLRDDRATVGDLRDALTTLPPPGLVHLACHGLLDRRDPAFSALALTATAEDDGLLTPARLAALRLPPDSPVLLSACEIASDASPQGEGLLGLVHALLTAGSPAVVANLWKIDDRTGVDWVKAFYGHLDGGVPDLASALARTRDAQARRHPHPFHWGGWVVWGEP